MTAGLDSWSALAGEGAVVLNGFAPIVILICGLLLLGAVTPFFIRLLRGSPNGDPGLPAFSRAGFGGGVHSSMGTWVNGGTAGSFKRMRTRATAAGARPGRPPRIGGKNANQTALDNRNATTTKIRAEAWRRQMDERQGSRTRREALDHQWAAWSRDPYMVRDPNGLPSKAPKGYAPKGDGTK